MTKEAKAARPPSRYREIAQALLSEIQVGRWPVGQRLPIETELCARFAAGRHTVRDALRILSERGLIVRRAGMGSMVVASDQPSLFTHTVGSLSEWMRYPPDTFRDTVRTDEVTADRDLAAQLKCEPGRRWFRMSSIRRGDFFAKPLGWTDIYVLPRYAAVAARRDHGRTPVHEQITKQFGEVTEHAQLEIFAGRLAEDVAAPLDADPGSPTLVVIRRYFGMQSGLFEITITVHPEGRYSYGMDLRRDRRGLS